MKTLFPGPVDTPLALYGLSADDAAEKRQIMHSAAYVATTIIELLQSDKQRMVFDEKRWDYLLQ